ncbi:MAG: phosphate acyltransferase PlsX [Alistipes sp.]|nr:phosphate acyltransferase PlsX [Alistipes sp.]
MIKIGIDVFGGDNAPEAVVEGAIAAQGVLGADCRIVLLGDRGSIMEHLSQRGCCAELFDIVHAPERIEMGDHPAESFRTKRNSSIVVGFNMLAKGEIDGFASAGSTGAMMVGSMMVAKPLAGVLRPTIAISIPTVKGSKVTILDIGINVDCRPEVLEQYAVIGSVYASEVIGQASPRVALLNIGEESSKGNAQAKAAYQLMSQAAEQGRYNFVGNVEPSHIFTGDVADVVVCDGFVGNTVLKLTEGLYAINAQQGAMTPFWQGLNYEQAGGTPVLGIGAVVTIGHGKSTPEAIKNMILKTKHSVEIDIVGKLREKF